MCCYIATDALLTCEKADASDYLLKDADRELDIGFTINASINSPYRGKFFENFKFLIAQPKEEDKTVAFWKQLIAMNLGKVYNLE